MMFSPEQLAEFLRNLGVFSIAASILISILIAIAGVIPSIFMTGANVLLFGPYYGLLISWLGETIGAVVSFYLYRWGFKKRLEQAAQKYVLLRKITGARGWKAGILLFEARLVPFIPSGFVTFAGSVSNSGMGVFLLATALGKLPSIALEVLVSYDVIHLSKNWLRLILVLLIIVTTVLLFQKKEGNRSS